MEIVGRGFIARHLAPLAGRYPDVTVIAAGVSTTAVDDVAAFDREAELVYQVLRRCRAEGRTVVFFSTSSHAIYGAEGSPGTEDGPVYPTSVYGRHKLALETAARSSGADWLILRLTHLIGRGQPPHQTIPLLVKGVLSGRVRVHRDTHRDMVDVRHMVIALDRLLADGVRNTVVNIASGIPQRMEAVVRGIEQRLGRVAEWHMVDVPRTDTTVSTKRLRELVPEVEDFGFGPDYLPALLDRYIGDIGKDHDHVPSGTATNEQQERDIYDRADTYETIYRGRGKDYAAESNTVIKLVTDRKPDASSLLDVACGYGGHLRYFSKAFRHVEGLDLSEKMISAAAAKIPDITVHHGDMRQFQLARRFDAVTCMFSSIGHLDTTYELAQTLRSFARHLTPGGVVVIDPWWFPETFLSGYVGSDLITEDGMTIARISHSVREGDATRMEVHYVVAERGKGIRHFVDIHRITLFSREEYEQAFRAAGCTVEYLPGEPAGRGVFVGVRV
jgi:dTDP-3-amino-3,6-dideoxy-alpha-D-glucopyranose N,N-dimethyltransferase/dTDP-3-amino-3,4,6-trideoxy-alpha-D-glucopyranose N,N-dimethyltransferase/N-methyltransferase